MANKKKKDVKRKCCRKFIKKDKHCSKCPASLNDELKKSLVKAQKEETSGGKKKKKEKKKKK